MLLLNAEALSGDYDMERLMGAQDMLSQRRGLSHETIEQVEQFRWGEGEEQVQTQCMVCLSDFEQGEEVRKLPCGHVFHVGCIDEWLRRCTDCPISSPMWAGLSNITEDEHGFVTSPSKLLIGILICAALVQYQLVFVTVFAELFLPT